MIRALAGLSLEAARTVEAQVPVRIASELGRQEFVLVALVEGAASPIAFPLAKGSGAVTSFSQADGFLQIDALAPALDAGSRASVTLIGAATRLPDLVIMGSHDVALDVVVGALAERGLSTRYCGRQPGGCGGSRTRRMRLVPVHLIDPGSGLAMCIWCGVGSRS